MLTFLGGNIDITDVFKAVILATLQSSKTKALTKAYSMILDNLEDAKELTFDMIHRACVRKLRERTDRGDDRQPERRPATPHRGSYTPYALCSRKPISTYLTRSTPTPMVTVPTGDPTPKRHPHLPMLKFRFFLYLFIVGSVQGLFS
jgi:hypothetical protein